MMAETIDWPSAANLKTKMVREVRTPGRFALVCRRGFQKK